MLNMPVELNRRLCISNKDGLTHFTKKTEPGGTLERFEFLVLKFRIVLYINMAKYACLGAPNMVNFGVLKKILQNAVQMRWSLVNRTLQSKVITKSHYLAGFPTVTIMQN